MSEPNNIKKTDRILEELKIRNYRKGNLAVEEDRVKLVIFTLESGCYAFFGADVKEILPYEKIHYVPGCPDAILGIINVRGDIKSVLDINKIFGFSESETTNRSRIIIAVKEDISSGILVDSVDHVIDVPKSHIKSPISTLDKSILGFISGITEYDSKTIAVLNVGKIFEEITN